MKDNSTYTWRAMRPEDTPLVRMMLSPVINISVNAAILGRRKTSGAIVEPHNIPAELIPLCEAMRHQTGSEAFIREPSDMPGWSVKMDGLWVVNLHSQQTHLSHQSHINICWL